MSVGKPFEYTFNNKYTSEWLQTQRTIFPYHKNIKTTSNLGDLVPYNLEEILPGDFFDFNIDGIVRVISPFIKAPMEELYLEVSHFFVPNRLVWENWKYFMGERVDYDVVGWNEKEIPLITFDKVTTNDKVFTGSIASYFGIPLPSPADYANDSMIMGINKLPFNGYALIYNTAYIDINTQQPKEINKTDENIQFIPENDAEVDFNDSSPTSYTGRVAKVNKYWDYFTNTYLDTQLGEPTLIPLAGTAPVITSTDNIASSNPLRWGAVGSTLPFSFTNGQKILMLPKGTTDTFSPNNVPGDYLANSYDDDVSFGNPTTSQAAVPLNLEADLSQTSAMTINDLRATLKIQQLKEMDLLAGRFYHQKLKSEFNIDNPDMIRLGYPRLIGTSTQRLQISQIVQTGSADGSDIGTVFGYSVNGVMSSGVNEVFTEHGIMFNLYTIRQRHTYQQGINRMFKKRKRTEFFTPILIGLGYQPVYQYEIYGYLPENSQGIIFGYNPSWEHYRVDINKITGMFNINSVVNSDDIATYEKSIQPPNQTLCQISGHYYTLIPGQTEIFSDAEYNFIDIKLQVQADSSVKASYYCIVEVNDVVIIDEKLKHSLAPGATNIIQKNYRIYPDDKIQVFIINRGETLACLVLGAGQTILKVSNAGVQSNTLAVWHFGDIYESPLVLTPAFKLETHELMDNTLQVPSNLVHQFGLDISHTGIKVRLVDALGKPTIN